MKRSAIILLGLFLSNLLSGQSTMRVNDTLKANSTIYKVKQEKPLVTFRGPTYSFGPYKILNRRENDPKVKSSALYRSHKSKGNKITASSGFRFSSNERDTIEIVQLRIRELLKEEKKKLYDLTEIRLFRKKIWVRYYEESLMSELTPLRGDDKWKMVIVRPKIEHEETDGNFVDLNWKDEREFMDELKIRGRLYNDETSIAIRRVNRLEEEKGIDRMVEKHFGPINYGYEFVYRDWVVAAVQTNDLRERRVWIHNELDAPVANIIASAVMSVLVDAWVE